MAAKAKHKNGYISLFIFLLCPVCHFRIVGQCKMMTILGTEKRKFLNNVFTVTI